MFGQDILDQDEVIFRGKWGRNEEGMRKGYMRWASRRDKRILLPLGWTVSGPFIGLHTAYRELVLDTKAR